MKTTNCLRMLALLPAVAVASMLIAQGEENTPQKTLLRVGVYDSRAVAIAFAGSDISEGIYKKKKAELDQAEAEGDTEKLKQLKEYGKNQQARRHLQGFGTEPVQDILQYIKNDIPEIAENAGVDIIVSKWMLDYESAESELVDVTNQLVAPFKPNERAMRWIQQIQELAPRPREEIEQHHEH